ncbi:Sas10/Utp3/C1D [Macleaya cordata]|uniref:Sas10/Utp3/C1D n=1 Tax=Macleaya cordata TaxID=56857 RepID=A0A200Q5S9_MACCD|nr:Sas10/Utp3/C1D [Macleaya cordata]
MGKGGKRQKKDTGNPKKRTRDEYFSAEEDMDDEVDAFHKQRDVVPLDLDGDVGISDEDDEHPVFDVKGADEEEDDDDDDENDNDDDDTGFVAKLARSEKYLRQKTGGVDDEIDSEDEEEGWRAKPWSRRKGDYYKADNIDFELQSSDEDLPAEEEAEALRLEKEQAKSRSIADYGVEDIDKYDSDSDREPTLEDILVKGKSSSKPRADKETQDDMDTAYEVVKKDISALSREEQMDVVYSSAPELVGLLSELNDAFDQLEGKVNPLLNKVNARESTSKGGMHYLEVKRLLLLTYCQAIGFYLLLKSEGHSVRDHPVLARLVELKNLLDKMKQLDGNLPAEIEEILNFDQNESRVEILKQSDAVTSETHTKDHGHSSVSAKTLEAVAPHETAKLVKVDLSKDFKSKEEKSKRQNDQVGKQSMEMLKIRASLEEKLKQKGILRSVAAKPEQAQKHLVPRVNRKLESFDDFDDEVINKEGVARGLSNGHASSLHSSKLSQLVAVKVNKPKVVSGDDDLPMRDDIGERRRKHELRVLAKAGVDSMDEDEDHLGASRRGGAELEGSDVEDEGETEESEEDEYYKQVKQARAAKLAAKAQIYSRTSAAPTLEETEVVDGKRQITYQMEKNRGLTRARKKLIKNPRKKYKLKHQKAVVRRKGQVRDVKRPSGPYGGEDTGINPNISRSIRF